MRNARYFLVEGAFFTFSGLAAGLSTYSSGWWRRQVLHIFVTSFFDIRIDYHRQLSNGGFCALFRRHLRQAGCFLHIKFQALSHTGTIFSICFVEDGSLA